jgi:CRP-like cAMP-binding protein
MSSPKHGGLSILKNIASAIVQSSHQNVYTSFYKKLFEDPLMILKFPDLQKHVHLIDPSSDTFFLQHFIEDTLRRHPEDRTNRQIEILHSLLETSVPFKKRFCKEWSERDIKMLWKSAKFIECDSMVPIYEIDGEAVYTYIIMTGTVRTMNHSHTKSNDQEKAPVDHLPKGIFGDEAVLGMPTRRSSAKAITACTLLAINKKDYSGLSGEKHTVEDRVKLLSKFSIFREYDAGKLYKLAAKCQGVEFTRGQLILKQGTCAPAMYFVKSGRLVRKRRFKNKSAVVTSINEQECFGESCCLKYHIKREVSEWFDVVTDSQKVEMLVLPREVCRKFDKDTLDTIRDSFILRQNFYKERLNSTRNFVGNLQEEATRAYGKGKGECMRSSSGQSLNFKKPSQPKAIIVNLQDTVPIHLYSENPQHNTQNRITNMLVTTNSFSSLNLGFHLKANVMPSHVAPPYRENALASTTPTNKPGELHQPADANSEAITLNLLQKMVQEDVCMHQPWRLKSPKEVEDNVKRKMEEKNQELSIKKPTFFSIDNSRPRSAPATMQINSKAWADSTTPMSPLYCLSTSSSTHGDQSDSNFGFNSNTFSPISASAARRRSFSSNTTPNRQIHPRSPLSVNLNMR